MDTSARIIAAAVDNGADIAGIASMSALENSPSRLLYPLLGRYEESFTANEQESDDTAAGHRARKTGSVLVIGIAHPASLPERDWWDGNGTPGNRMLIDSLAQTRQQLEKTMGVRCHRLHYYVEKGGVFLKDAAVLAGLGCIGRNNLLITPDFGPRIRLRALLLEAELRSTGPLSFEPCADCDVNCRNICPEKSMREKCHFTANTKLRALPARDGTYDREACGYRMEEDIARSRENGGISKHIPVKYCRKCELVCPVGQDSRALPAHTATIRKNPG